MFNRGFTLLELIVAITIIGILTTIVIANTSSSKAAGRDARRVADIKSIQLALRMYYRDNSHYPQTLQELVDGKYLPKLPQDPGSTSYVYTAHRKGAGTCSESAISRYHLGAILEISGSNWLTQDDDFDVTSYPACSGSAFNGDATDCSGTSPGTDNCYDVTNNVAL